jgi:hypothetical protein
VTTKDPSELAFAALRLLAVICASAFPDEISPESDEFAEVRAMLVDDLKELGFSSMNS